MSAIRATQLFHRADLIEERLCRRMHGLSRRRSVRTVFRVASRLGDGPAWYALIALLPLAYGRAALRPAVAMALAAVVGIAVYAALKRILVRERPFVTVAGIQPGTAPLDRYSFPSGHTLHAVSFTLIAVTHFPVLGWILVPFACLVAASRVILGLHYPTDVIAGGLIGALLAVGAMASV